MITLCCTVTAIAIYVLLLFIAVLSMCEVQSNKLSQILKRLIEMSTSDTDKDKGNHTYYTEGHVMGLSIVCNTAKEIKIEPTPSYMVEDGERKMILFVSSEKQEEPDGTTKAVLCELTEQKHYTSEVDASVFLQLKQSHAKVRFELDSVREKIVKVTVL